MGGLPHHHLAEYGVVVSGVAKVTTGYKEILLTENQSTYMPQKMQGK
jgi:mannose-6-phosphate isomerase-like protein (cupin superfamily)